MTTNMLQLFLATLVVIVGISAYIKQMAPIWEEREYFASFKGHWWEGITISSLISLFIFYLLLTKTDPSMWVSEYGGMYSIDFSETSTITNIAYIIIPFMIFTYIMLFSAWTDLWSGHAPSEIAWFGIILSSPFLIGYLFSNDKPMIGLSIGIIGLIAFLLYFNRGLGDADVRLLWLVNIATVWWVGLYWTVMLFAIASFIQIIVHIVAQKTGWGRLVEIKYSKREKAFRKFAAKFNKKIDPSKEKRARRHVPFIPVMSLTWVVGLTVFLLFFPNELSINNIFDVKGFL